MAVVELKTRKSQASVAAFLARVKDAQRRKDCQAVSKLMQAATGEPPKMWGASIVGFGQVRYVGRSREVDWFKVGFSPRKSDLTLYLALNLDSLQSELEGSAGTSAARDASTSDPSPTWTSRCCSG
jgi:hypothetical protein